MITAQPVEVIKDVLGVVLAEKRDQVDEDILIFVEHSHRWVTEGIWPVMGANVNIAIAKLEDEGFARDEARLFLEGLTILQLKRMDYKMGPVIYRYRVPAPRELTESEIREMIKEGEAIPASDEYVGGMR